jgi:hypothetical protein
VKQFAMNTHRSTVALALALCAAMVACGGDDTASSTGDAASDGLSEGSSGEGSVKDGSSEASTDGSSGDGSADDSSQPSPDGASPGDASNNKPDAVANDGSTTPDGTSGSSPDAGSAVDASGDAPSSQGNDDATLDGAMGTVVVTADATLQMGASGSTCAAVNFVFVAPNETTVGEAIGLNASGVDPQGQSADVTLTWSVMGSVGTLSATTGTSNTFTCTAVGSAMVTVTAAISDGGASCANTGSQTVTVTCDSD